MVVKKLLEKHGLEVTVVEDGQQAVDQALRHTFDLILMDIQMPGLNGHEATQLLRQRGLTIPIVAFTAGAMKGDESRCLEAGCDAYLAKPINPRRLVQVLSEYLAPGPENLPEGKAAAGVIDLRREPAPPEEVQRRATRSGRDSEVIDWPDLTRRIEDDAFAQELVMIFVENNANRLRALTEATRAAAGEQMRSLSHAIKGAAATIAARSLCQAAGNLEKAANAGRLETAEALLAKVEIEFERLRSYTAREGWVERARAHAGRNGL